MQRFLQKYQRELAVAVAYLVLLGLVAIVSPTFFSLGNVRDLALSNAAVLLVAVGMTLVILAGQIDISVGSQVAVCSVAAGLLAKAGLPLPLLFIVLLAFGAL